VRVNGRCAPRGDDEKIPDGQPWSCGLELSAGEKALGAGIVLGAVGGAAGLVVGALVGSRDRYELVEPGAPRVTAAPDPGGATGQLAWSF
jgi:hypothetical protein